MRPVRRLAQEEGIHEEVTTAAITRALQKTTAADHAAISRFILDDAQWEAFTAALDAPARSLLRLQVLLRDRRIGRQPGQASPPC
jgi:uncharacterized protein (DUF1778 family)